MLARLALLIHWSIYCTVIVFWGWLFILEGESLIKWSVQMWTADYQTGLFKWIAFAVYSIGPPTIFTLLYWVIKGCWVLFPWQHVKND